MKKKHYTRTNPLGTRRCCDVESKLMTLIRRRNTVVCLVGSYSAVFITVLYVSLISMDVYLIMMIILFILDLFSQ